MIRSDQHVRWKVLANVNYGRDLDAYIPGAPNFQYWEVVSSKEALRLGIHNIPTEAEWIAAEYFAVHVLQPLRDKRGRIVLNSWYRCPALNKAIGSTPSSFHTRGGGGDLEPQECTLMELLEEAYKLPIWSEIIAEFFPYGWVHIGLLKGDNRRILKLKDSTHNFSRVTIETLRKLY